MHGWLHRDEFEEQAARLRLTTDHPGYLAFYLASVGGLNAAQVAREMGLPAPEAARLLGEVLIRWQEGKRISPTLEKARELLEVMQGPRPGAPAAPVIGFDKHHPNDPAYARRVAVRARVLTAEDLAYGEGWRQASVVEQAQRQKKARREKRQQKGAGA
jgi:hypothetical protein